MRGSRLIRATIPRDSVFLAQTPQAFRRDVLARALAEGTDVDATDEAMLVERLGAAGSRRRRRCPKREDHDAGRFSGWLKVVRKATALAVA